jgi:hypothetical protein
MRVAAALALAVLLLAGCAEPDAPDSPPPIPSTPPPAQPEYTLTLRVSEEAPDGPPLAGAEVEAYPMDAAGKPGPGVGRVTAADGTVRFSFREPTALALRAWLPGWTREGALVAVGPDVSSGDALVSERDLFLPLYRAELAVAASSALATSTAFDSAPALADLPVPRAYLDRLAGADVAVRWDETPTRRADLAAGLAWDGRVAVQGEPSGLAPAPGAREATWSGDLAPAGGRLSAAAVLNSAAVGDVPLAFEVALRFAGREPEGLLAPCHCGPAGPAPPLPPLPPLPPPPRPA